MPIRQDILDDRDATLEDTKISFDPAMVLDM